MARSTQVLKMNVLGAAFVCTFTPGRKNGNAYQLYRRWWEPGKYGMHERKLRIAEYANFESVLWHLSQMHLPEFSRDYFPAE